MTLGEKLQNLRKENMLSQEKLAELVGVSRQSVSKWENGLSNPDTENLILLAEIFNISVDEFIEGGSVRSGFSEKTKGKRIKEEFMTEETKNKPKIYWYILGAIIGFLVFAVSMTFVESSEILIITGIVGMVGMSYCISNIVNLSTKC